jgi:hypothetical protein
MAKMLNMINNCLPREAGNGWKLPTFHNTMHMVDDMCKYRKPKEANTKVGEKNHKFFAKCCGCHCRKQHKSFTHQVSVCLSDLFVIEKLASAMGLLANKDEMHCTSFPNHQGNDNEEGTTFGATHCSLHLDGNNVFVNRKTFVNLQCCCCYLFKRKLHVN